MLRTTLYADPENRFLHELIFDSCQRYPAKTAIVDTSASRRITYGEYGELVCTVARGLTVAGLKPGEVVAIHSFNSWEFCAAYHAITLAGGIPTLLNPSYREREIRYQLENSGAAMLISDGVLLSDVNLEGLPILRRVYTTRNPKAGTEPFSDLLRPATGAFAGKRSHRVKLSPRFLIRAAPRDCPRASCSHTSISWPTSFRSSAPTRST